MTIPSSILVGKVMHQRLRPVLHRFIYPIFFVKINLAEMASLNSWAFGVNRWRPLSLYFKDYGSRDGGDLLAWIRQLLASQGLSVDGDILLLTMPRLFGYAFNPISIWYCHNQQGELMAVLAEVNNTFGEHYLYLLREESGEPIQKHSVMTAKKMMHVSPFCEVKGSYAFVFTERAQHSLLKIDYRDDEAGDVLINTAIDGKKIAFSDANLIKVLLRQPWMTVGVVWRIHWHALLLWLKRVPFFRQPAAAKSTITLNHQVTIASQNEIGEGNKR